MRISAAFTSAVAVMVACGALLGAPSATAQPVLGVGVGLSLSATVVAAGGDLLATLTITKDSGHPVYYGKNCRDEGVRVGLSSSAEPFTPDWTGPSCAGRLLVNVRRVLEVRVPATYVPCAGSRKCTDLRVTPLPPGLYNTQMYFRGFPGGMATPSEPLFVRVVAVKPPAPTGTIRGRFLYSAPLPGGTERPIPGIVTLTRTRPATGGVSDDVVVTVGRSGDFDVHVPPGTWLATGKSPDFRGSEGPALCTAGVARVVSANEVTRVSVVCVGI